MLKVVTGVRKGQDANWKDTSLKIAVSEIPDDSHEEVPDNVV